MPATFYIASLPFQDTPPNSGYRVSHDRGDVTVGNETPGWPSPTPSSATTTSSAIFRSDLHIMLVCGL
jgi:hypothetical protein